MSCSLILLPIRIWLLLRCVFRGHPLSPFPSLYSPNLKKLVFFPLPALRRSFTYNLCYGRRKFSFHCLTEVLLSSVTQGEHFRKRAAGRTSMEESNQLNSIYKLQVADWLQNCFPCLHWLKTHKRFLQRLPVLYSPSTDSNIHFSLNQFRHACVLINMMPAPSAVTYSTNKQ